MSLCSNSEPNFSVTTVSSRLTPQPPSIDPAGIQVWTDPMIFNLALEARGKFKFSNLQHILVYS